MSWVIGQRYRGRAVQGQIQVERLQNANRTASVVGLIEVTLGNNLGQRLRWRGWLNNTKNQEDTIGELRAMGMRGARLGDWNGIGTKDVEFTVFEDVGSDGRTYYRAAFVRPLQTVKEERAVDDSDLDALNAELGGLLRPDAPRGAPGPVPTPPDAQEWSPTAKGNGTSEIPF